MKLEVWDERAKIHYPGAKNIERWLDNEPNEINNPKATMLDDWMMRKMQSG